MKQLIFLAILIGIGVMTQQPARYWISVVLAALVQELHAYLFNGDEGVLDPIIENAIGGGPLLGPYLVGLMLLGWGLPIFIVFCGYTKKRAGES